MLVSGVKRGLRPVEPGGRGSCPPSPPDRRANLRAPRLRRPSPRDSRTGHRSCHDGSTCGRPGRGLHEGVALITGPRRYRRGPRGPKWPLVTRLLGLPLRDAPPGSTTTTSTWGQVVLSRHHDRVDAGHRRATTRRSDQTWSSPSASGWATATATLGRRGLRRATRTKSLGSTTAMHTPITSGLAWSSNTSPARQVSHLLHASTLRGSHRRMTTATFMLMR